jgi:hypothetical protein
MKEEIKQLQQVFVKLTEVVVKNHFYTQQIEEELYELKEIIKNIKNETNKN